MVSFLKGLISGGTKGIAVEVNSDRINMIELQRRGQSGFKIARFASEILPEGVVEEGRINDPIQLGEVVRRLYTENKFGASRVATAIPGRETVSRLIKLPAEIPPDELRDMVLNQEASLYLPFPREDADVDYSELGVSLDDDGIERKEILMVATPKEVTDTYLQTMQIAQLNVDVVEVSSFALVRTLRSELSKFASSAEAVAVVDIEYESTEITITVDGIPQFSRTVGIGTSQIQNAQLRSINLPPLRNTDLERIQQMTVPLQTMDTAGLGGGTGTPGEAAVLRVLSDLADELRRSIDFYTSQTAGADVVQLLIGGPGAAIDQLDEFFGQRLGITATQVDPLVALSITADQDYSRAERMSMSIVIGLGLREVGLGAKEASQSLFTIDINFLRDRQAIEGEGTAQPIADVQWLIGGGVAAALLLSLSGGAYFYLNGENSRLQAEIQRLEASEKGLDEQLAIIKKSEQEAKEIDGQTSKLVQLFVGEVPASALLQDIRERTPLNVRIDTVAQLGKKVSLSGQAAAAGSSGPNAFEQVNDFILKLQESPYIAAKGVTLKSIKLNPPTKDVSVDLAQYQVELTLTPQTALTLQGALQQSGSEGLISRIATLKEKGIDPAKLQSETQEGEKTQ